MRCGLGAKKSAKEGPLLMRRDDDVEDGGPISHGKISSLQLHMPDDEREEEREKVQLSDWERSRRS